MSNLAKSTLLLCITLFLPIQSWAKMDDYKYKRALEITDKWHAILLPKDIYGKTLQNLYDIRIYGITANNDTIEAPYILKANKPKTVYSDFPFKVMNTTKKDNLHYITFKSNDPHTINNIQLKFENANFDWHVKLQGSNDQSNWFTIINDYRILSISNEEIEYNYTKVTFPPSEYKYFRLEIPSKEKPILKDAKLTRLDKQNGIADTVSIDHKDMVIDEKETKTEIAIKLADFIRTSEVEVDILNDFEYYRDITIKYIKDSVKTESDWVYQTEILSKEKLNSLEESKFSFKSTNLNNLIITIKNDHNQRLNINKIKLICYQHLLMARFTQDAKYYLCYGKKWESKPDYDIVNFKNQIPENIKPIPVGKEEVINIHNNRIVKPLFNKYWLWAIMFVIILLLGWSSKQLINKTKE
ncbi:discoidin domain-containing protein [Plebeiibacterium sediminum]|uniref:Discoidin domain-containing protein n=1 Tax=Plebeiibacterium sediminum TaxID=2992112 RepID=A0AAE3M8M3_9BACT|nr:discoidin domain-containing protein [Plebeiobacterium sediminum]MCW3789184.1 discoidin domain-containing protein [Plebeiobacterium sediminum]